MPIRIGWLSSEEFVKSFELLLKGGLKNQQVGLGLVLFWFDSCGWEVGSSESH